MYIVQYLNNKVCIYSGVCLCDYGHWGLKYLHVLVHVHVHTCVSLCTLSLYVVLVTCTSTYIGVLYMQVYTDSESSIYV